MCDRGCPGSSSPNLSLSRPICGAPFHDVIESALPHLRREKSLGHLNLNWLRSSALLAVRDVAFTDCSGSKPSGKGTVSDNGTRRKTASPTQRQALPIRVGWPLRPSFASVCQTQAIITLFCEELRKSS
jgi:hypothetical protein